MADQQPAQGSSIAAGAPLHLPVINAPHRLLFLAGACNVLLAMAWWALWLVDARWSIVGMPSPPIPAGWLHAFLMQYQLLPPFFFGFLLTVFPRWMNLPALTRRHYVPVGGLLFLGQLVTLMGAWGSMALLRIGAVLTLLGWCFGLTLLGRLLLQETGRTWHARSCFTALFAGVLGQAAFLRFLFTFDSLAYFLAVQIGTTLMLLPVFITVCHRMIPFFAGAVIPGYRAWRPLWLLGAIWALLVVHTVLALLHAYPWLWLADAPLCVLTASMLWRWWSPAALRTPLLLVLYVGFSWLPLALALFTIQSVWYAMSGDFVLGRAPEHALFVGCFGSLLVAMVTRVTQGHSGRPLVLGKIPALCFLLLQCVAWLRVAAEIAPDHAAWLAAAAVAWLLAFAPWVLRSAWIYLTPRIDGAAG